MKNPMLVTIFFVVLLLFVAPVVFALGIDFLPNASQPPLEFTRGIYGNIGLRQDFTSTRERLSGIAFTIKNPNLAYKKDVNFVLYSEDGELLRTSSLSGMNIEDGSFVSFTFDPIEESENKNYFFTIYAPQAGTDDSLQIFYTDNTPVWMGSLRVIDKEVEIVEGGISFISLHKPESKISMISGIYMSWLRRLFSDRGFFLIYVLDLVGLSILVLVNLPHLNRFIGKNSGK